MTLAIQCPQCQKRYRVKDGLAGKQVRCQQCGAQFTAEAAAELSSTQAATAVPAANASAAAIDPLGPSDPLAGIDLASLAALPAAPLAAPANPLGTPLASAAAPSFGWPAASQGQYVSNPSGGPTDFGFRLICGGMILGGFGLIAICIITDVMLGWVSMWLVAFTPLMFILGVAGVISPNSVRAIGKFGGHLPWHYKAIGWSLLGVWFIMFILILVGMHMAGYEPERPGRPQPRHGGR